MDMSGLIDWIGARLQERSTWLGLISMLTSAGVALSPQQMQLIVVAGVAVSGGVMMFTKDHSFGDAVSKAVADALAAQQASVAAPAALAAPTEEPVPEPTPAAPTA